MRLQNTVDVRDSPVYRRGKQLKLGPNNGDARSIVTFVRYLTAPVSQKLNGAKAVSEWLRCLQGSNP